MLIIIITTRKRNRKKENANRTTIFISFSFSLIANTPSHANVEIKANKLSKIVIII